MSGEVCGDIDSLAQAQVRNKTDWLPQIFVFFLGKLDQQWRWNVSHLTFLFVMPVGGVRQLHTEQTTALLSLLSASIVERLVLHLSTLLVCCCCTYLQHPHLGCLWRRFLQQLWKLGTYHDEVPNRPIQRGQHKSNLINSFTVVTVLKNICLLKWVLIVFLYN